MTKECPVIINNGAVTVVKFGDKEIQLPAIGKNVKTVKVKCVKGKYTIADKPETKTEPEQEQNKEMKAIEDEMGIV